MNFVSSVFFQIFQDSIFQDKEKLKLKTELNNKQRW